MVLPEAEGQRGQVYLTFVELLPVLKGTVGRPPLLRQESHAEVSQGLLGDLQGKW